MRVDYLVSMRGVTDEGTAGTRAVAAIEAGADLALLAAFSEIEQIAAAIVEQAAADPSFAA